MDVQEGPRCPHRPPCPGCPALGQDADTLEIAGRLLDFGQRHGARLSTADATPAQGYRHRARLAVRGRAASPKVGIFQAGSHRIVDTPNCLVHHPRINEVAQHLRRGIRATGLAPYADGPHRGLVRYLQVTVHPSDASVQLVLVTNDRTPETARPLLDYLVEALGTTLQGLFWNGQDARDNRILGPRFVAVAGAPAMDITIAGARAFFPPGAFCQNNPRVYQAIAEQVVAWVPAGAEVLELYAGVGTLGLACLQHARGVTFNEVAPDSLAGLEMGIAALAAQDRARTRLRPGAAGEQLAELATVDTVIVDPPRKGLDAALLPHLGGPAGPANLVYVSCGPESFMVDAEAILGQGRLKLLELRLFDLFPWTGHLEVAARFGTLAPG